MLSLSRLTFILATTAVTATGALAVVTRDGALPGSECTIRETARQTHMFVGGITNRNHGPTERAVLAQHVNAVTAENEMKWGDIAPTVGDVVSACMAVETCRAITLWGLADPHPWLGHYPPFDSAAPNAPLLLDANLAPKPAYFAVHGLAPISPRSPMRWRARPVSASATSADKVETLRVDLACSDGPG